MATSKPDLVIVHPGGAGVYGDLDPNLVAVEPPLWARLIAGYVRDRDYSVKIIDAEADRQGPHEVGQLVRDLDPRLVCVAAYGHQPSASTQTMAAASKIVRAIKDQCAVPTIMVGGHVSALPEATMREFGPTFACVGEGPVTVVKLLAADGRWENVPGLVWWFPDDSVRINPSAPLLDPKDLHGNAWDLLPMYRYRAHNWQAFGDAAGRTPYASIYTTLGCPYRCLRGDTLVQTIYGDIPIRELSERFGDAGVPVYTYDRNKKTPLISQAVNIRKYGVHEPLVRVAFDDGTHIDCTPDHEMMTFRWGNNRAGTIETPVQAQNLAPGMRIRAIREERVGDGYVAVACGRKWRRQRSRVVMEYALGRRLKSREQVHHKDRNRANDHPDNLQHFASASDHLREHAEVAERMRQNNPAKHMTDAWRQKIGAAVTGKVRTVKHRLHYRASKLGAKNPNYKHGKRTGYSRIPNHVVVSITHLVQRDDVYCLEVPGYGWFFANNILVKNCTFCCINAPFGGPGYRMRAPADVVDEILHLHTHFGVRMFKITDEMFVLKEGHYSAICQGIIDAGLGGKLNIWAYARIDTVKPERLRLLREAGVRWLALGIESASAFVRDGAAKSFRATDIEEMVRAIQAAGINVIANYIFGLPDDDSARMTETLLLAKRLNTEFANFYSAMAYPGSALYIQAVKEGWTLPDSWLGYSQHSYDCRPLDTKHVNAAEVLRFRDMAFHDYFTNDSYLDMIAAKWGPIVEHEILAMTRHKLRRRLLEDREAAIPA